MILNGDQIRERCDDASSPPEIFKPDTWGDSGFTEASYVLRVATDQVMIDGTFYEKGNHYPGTFLEIKPGRIAVLSTMEELIMPNDLVGKIGIRIRYALKGLTGLIPNPPMGGVKAGQIGMREPTREKAWAPLGPM